MMCPNFICWILQVLKDPKALKALQIQDYLLASSIATATATVIPTMGLLPAPMRPIILKLLFQGRPFVIFAAWHICGFVHSGIRTVETPAFAFCTVWFDRDPHAESVGLSYARPIWAGRAIRPWSGIFVWHNRASFCVFCESVASFQDHYISKAKKCQVLHIALLVYVLDSHLRVKVLIEIQVALSIMIYSAFP